MRIRTHRELDVYKLAFKASMRIFELSKNFPREEQYSLTDQIRRSSRSVCANVTEAFRKRKYSYPDYSPRNFVVGKAKFKLRRESYMLYVDQAI